MIATSSSNCTPSIAPANVYQRIIRPKIKFFKAPACNRQLSKGVGQVRQVDASTAHPIQARFMHPRPMTMSLLSCQPGVISSRCILPFCHFLTGANPLHHTDAAAQRSQAPNLFVYQSNTHYFPRMLLPHLGSTSMHGSISEMRPEHWEPLLNTHRSSVSTAQTWFPPTVFSKESNPRAPISTSSLHTIEIPTSALPSGSVVSGYKRKAVVKTAKNFL